MSAGKRVVVTQPAVATHQGIYCDNSIETWSDEDHLLLLECWSRDGYQFGDIAQMIGIGLNTLVKWRSKNPEINKALSQGRELIDYKVENALLKSALGYKTKEVKITTTVRNGKVVETIKEVTDKEQAPNVSAIQCWLYNRRSDKWRNMNSRANIIDELSEDSNIEITITRQGSNTNNSQQQNVNKDNGAKEEVDKEWQDEINKSVTLRSKTEAEKAKNKKKEKEQRKKDRAKSERGLKTKIEEVDSEDLDYWPDDWEDENE